MSHDWTPPDSWIRLTTIDAHTAGEPFRVITGGVPEPQGETILERRRWAREHLEPYRRALMWEPRGHADMYGGLMVPPSHPEAEVGVLFLHNEGYSSMCGHGIIGLVTVLVGCDLYPVTGPETRIAIEAPAGLVVAHARVEAGRVESVRFRNVPSFVAELDAEVEVRGHGRVRYDLAYGGAFYAYVEAAPLGLRCEPEGVGELIAAGRAIKAAVASSRAIEHPFEPDLGFLYGVIFYEAGHSSGHRYRNVCVFADGEVDRSPTGTGVSGRAAIEHARGRLAPGETITIESILGTTFDVRLLEETDFGPHAAVLPEVTGSARITGRHEFLIDPDDPLREGFLLH